ncbi:MAG: S8 family peptidase [Paramuribaculum sp.]|nr:S8 family peptidase [Paramuribaculum sp.]
MNKLYAILTASLLAGAMTAPSVGQNKLNMQGSALLEEYQAQRAQRIRTIGLKAVEAEPSPLQGAIVVLNSGETSESLRQKGFEVQSDLGSIVTVSLPMDSVQTLLDMPQVKSVSMGGKKRLLMNNARNASKVTEAHSGISLGNTTAKYDGSGVIVGLMDGGMEPNHVNFLNEDGTSRVKRLWVYDSYSTTPQSYTTESAIKNFTTEDRTETHGTHVAGIMAGSYNRTGKYYSSSNATTGNIPYYGVATGADIAISCGDLTDEAIIDGVERIIEYAEQQGQPAAVNLSLGSNYGPHDGSDAFSQALDALGERAIICVAAGNEGEDNITIEKNFNSDNDELKTFVYFNNAYGYNGIYGILDIWGSDDIPLTVTISAYKTSTKTLTTLATFSGRKNTTISRSTNSTAISSGTMTVSAGVDANNDRYNVYAECNTLKLASGYRLVISVKGQPGQKANLYFEGNSTFCASPSGPNGAAVSGYTNGSPDQSINSMACGDNILSVGAYVSSTSWYTPEGKMGYNPGSGFNNGAIAPYSSYGTRFQGDKLPHVCAPGSAIISSYSRYYVSYCNSNYGYDDYGTTSAMTATATNGTATDYWGEMDGTSMATPFMTGVAALWLQADPSLTISDIKKVVNQSSTTDSYTNSTRWGAGKVNAAEGLRTILANLASIGSVEHELTSDNINMTADHGSLKITAPGASALKAEVYSINGIKTVEAHASGDILTVDTQRLARGLYVVRVTSPTGSVIKKITL